ncbi:MAG: hypothetical protein AB8B51_01025 [Sedimentitalea sp.]
MFPNLVTLDSITDATAQMAGQVGISGSHGGHLAAAIASRSGLRAVVLNDAGIGLSGAGIAGLKALDTVGMAGVSVTASSAEIGSATDAMENGIVGFVNETARVLGMVAGLALHEQITALLQAPPPSGILPKVVEARQCIDIAGKTVLCVDSASLITPADAGRLIVTGSHGGLIGGDPARACKADAGLVAYNDAGGGKNDIGFSRLPALQQRGIAAVTLDHETCRIGDAVSGLMSGVISRCNAPARALGLDIGQNVKNILGRLG